MPSIRPVRIAVIGCGAISRIYFENMKNRFTILELFGCCDLNGQLAAETAERYDIKALTIDEILADETIELVVNLTTPAAHYEVIKQLLESSKHVYTEKVLAYPLERALEIKKLADEKGLLLAAAPDTFLGAAVQTARFAVDCGLIGEVTSCVATLQRDSALLSEKFPYTANAGGGIGIDVGIYYATALLSILGPVERVSGFSKTHNPNRKHFFTSRGHFGEDFKITAETLLAGTAQFKSGAVGSFHFNSASIRCERPQVVIYGTEGILYLPDPNFFGGDVRLLLKGQQEPCIFPHTHAYDGDDRGLGVAEMAWSLRLGRTPRADKALSCHALELLSGMIKSGETGMAYNMSTTFERPDMLPRGYMGESYAMSEPEAALAF